MKIKNVTSLEESERLLQAGIDPKTADFWWSDRAIAENGTTAILITTKKDILYSWRWSEEDDVPAWSLQALCDLVPGVTLISSGEDNGLNEVWFEGSSKAGKKSLISLIVDLITEEYKTKE